MAQTCHGYVYLDACGTNNAYYRSANIVLANAGCKCSHTHFVRRPN